MTKARKSSKGKPGLKDTGAPTTHDGKSPIQTILAEGEESRPLDQIRDIIFGRQMMAYEERFAQLEQRITTQIDTLRCDNDAQLESMDEKIKQSNDAFSQLLENEQFDRGQESKALSKEIVNAEKALTATIDSLSDRQQKDIESLNEKLSVLTGELSEKIHALQVEASKQLEEAVHQLDDTKVARKVLSRMLKDMAGRLADEPE